MTHCTPGSDLVLLAASIAINISSELSADDTGVLAGLFTSIGDNLTIIAGQKQLSENPD